MTDRDTSFALLGVFGQFVCIVIEAKSVALNLFPRVIRFVRSEKCVWV